MALAMPKTMLTHNVTLFVLKNKHKNDYNLLNFSFSRYHCESLIYTIYSALSCFSALQYSVILRAVGPTAHVKKLVRLPP